MCGIAGFCRHPADTFNANVLAKSLLLGIEHRGQDATGAAWRDRRGRTVSSKYAVTAKTFVEKLSVDSQADVAVLHTRFATQGHQSINDNNHPLYAGPITGVHNGMVTNDRELLTSAPNYERKGTVDSQAIFATLNRVGTDLKLRDALELIEAKMALAWLDDSDPDAAILHLARGDGSPLWIGQSAAGTLIFASTKEVVEQGFKDIDLDLTYLDEVDEGTYYTVHQGRIVRAESFFPTPMYGSYYSRSWGGSTPKSSGVLTSTSSSTYVKSSGTTVTTYGKKADFLDLTYLDAEKHIPTMPYKEAHEKWPKRESDINTWVDENVYDRVTGELRPDEDVFARAAERGAFLRPGSWVATYVCGQLADAQVYRLPNSFPDGTYIVRVLVPVYDEEGTYSGVEATYLARTIADIVDGDDLYIEATPETSDTEKKEVMVNA